jgi:hypothetical protein
VEARLRAFLTSPILRLRPLPLECLRGGAEEGVATTGLTSAVTHSKGKRKLGKKKNIYIYIYIYALCRQNLTLLRRRHRWENNIKADFKNMELSRCGPNPSIGSCAHGNEPSGYG